MFTYTKLANATKMALTLGVVTTGLGSSQNLLAQETSEDDNVEKISITGSRIQRTDIEGALPVSIISREDIVASGDVSIGEVLRNFPGNNQGSFTPQAGSSAQTTTNVSLRGLGSNRTLVLVNGRRLPSDGLGGGSGQNLSLIPAAAVERIEVLRDGASAIYGSEAIAGVINIILREDFDGMQFSLRSGKPSRSGGGNEDVFSVVGGFSSDKGNLTFVAEHKEVTTLFQNERESIAANRDGWVGYSDNSDPANYRVRDFFGDGTSVLGPWQPAANCETDNVRETPGILRTNPVTGEQQTVTNRECMFPFANVSAWLPSFKNSTLFVNGNVSVTDNLEVFAQSTFTRLESFARYAPIPLVDGFGMTVQATDPLNPTFGSDDPQNVLVKWRPQALGNRNFRIETIQMDFQTGFTWNTDVGSLSASAQWAKQDSSDKTENLVLFSAVFDAIENNQINPFGNPDDVAAAADLIRADSFREAEVDLEVYNIDWGGEWDFGLSGGDLAYSVGYEFRSEDFAETFDPLTRTGAIFGSVGAPSGGGRDSRSAYIEVVVPILDELEVSYAGRHDKFSLPDVGEFTQSVRARYEVNDDVVIRASFAEGFRVPDIDTLLQEGGSSTDQAIDRTSCNSVGGDLSNPLCITGEITAERRPGADTQPEFSETLSLGIAWDISENWGLVVDWYNTEITDQISFLSTQSVLDLEATGVDPTVFNVDVERDNQGEIIKVINGFANLPGFETSGIDVSTNYTLTDTDFGDFRLKFDATYVLNFDREIAPGVGVFDVVGYATGGGGNPEYRAVAGVDWLFGGFSANMSVNHTAGYDARSPEDEFLNNVPADVGTLPSHTTIDASVNYTASWGTTVTLGARNLTDKVSVSNLHAFGNDVYDKNLGEIIGRVVYFNLKHDF
jgi:iron complex outermembrane receptor protein